MGAMLPFSRARSSRLRPPTNSHHPGLVHVSWGIGFMDPPLDREGPFRPAWGVFPRSWDPDRPYGILGRAADRQTESRGRQHWGTGSCWQSLF